ncbi:lysoplasmalogenase [Alpinimonas psychrophila]|uniref:Putative membrane protein YhhN n=1 Tax=Alpinimonas psychrophila TaxID=748908 RepID=A0A7W3PNU2_9MICO|nr:putative membrane protein YhhN [Alpinimonas psychrophila]
MARFSLTGTVAGMKNIRRFAFVPYIVLCVVHFVAIAAHQDDVVAATKPLLMALLLVTFLVAAPRLTMPTLVLTSLALAFSMAGDVSLQSPASIGFLIGLAFFFLAQISYITLFVKVGSGKLSWFTSLYAAWFVALIVILLPGLGSLTIPVMVYGLVLGSMATLATRVNSVTATGGALFLASDTLLALDRFAPNITMIFSDELIMGTYMVGEGLLVFGIVRYLNRATPEI